ncbi:hypothetical protein AVEN_17753-1 [Araneus ventricosus]|uniref:Uncharacterized protein n=1 Tax=Araneus ventricosus TaxID=182803 RepID=A0A4Y2X2X2_ARAVE|nr:hypothetical protein AVEN_17753-1 [Araneus ventricosus]
MNLSEGGKKSSQIDNQYVCLPAGRPNFSIIIIQTIVFVRKISTILVCVNEYQCIKQPPDATSSSDSYVEISPSPRPQTYGLLPSRGSPTRTLIKPPRSL